LPPSTPPPCAGIPAGAVATAPRAARTVTTPARPAPVATLRAGLRAAAHARGWQPYERLGAPGPQGGPACALDLDLFLRRSDPVTEGCVRDGETLDDSDGKDRKWDSCLAIARLLCPHPPAHQAKDSLVAPRFSQNGKPPRRRRTLSQVF